MLKIGRYTAALLLVTVGVMLLADQTTGSNYLRVMFDWWPLILISLGCEYLIFTFIYRKGERQLRLDLGGLIIAVLISAVVVGTTQASHLPFDRFKNIRIDTLDLSFSSESGDSFDKGVTAIPLASGTEKVVIDNPNGSVEVKGGPVQDIEVRTTVWVDKLSAEEAKKIADESVIDYSAGKNLTITAKGKEYTGGFPNKRKPRMNLVITVPADRKADYDLQLRNGKVTVDGISVIKEIKARTTNGTVTVTGLDGSLTASSTNGAVEVSNVKGSVNVSTTNGSVTARDIGADVEADTTNGAVTAERVGGKVDADTTNGRITVREASGAVRVDATNGSVTVASSKVGGDYDLETMHGSVELLIPADADVEVRGSTSFSSISTNLPLTVDGKKISGRLGSGTYKIKIDTNSKIDVNKFD